MPGPIKPILDHLREALAFLGEPKTKRASHNNTLVYRLESEILPIMPIRLKVEINCREHFHQLDWVHLPFRMNNDWFSGECRITTYELDELLGTKMRALYQRRKGRDLIRSAPGSFRRNNSCRSHSFVFSHLYGNS